MFFHSAFFELFRNRGTWVCCMLKGALSRGVCCFQLHSSHSLLKLLPGTFTRPQNTPDGLTGTYQKNGGSESKR